MMRWSRPFPTLASSTLYFSACVYVFSNAVSPCPPGYAPPDCSDQCPAGSYGHSCLSSCPSTCYKPACKADSGDCFRCRLGFSGAKCSQRCPRGKFGQDCGLRCPANCKRAECDSFSGFCHSCLTGFGGSTCETKLGIDLVSARTRMQSDLGSEGGSDGGGGKHRGGFDSSSSDDGGKFNRNKSGSGGDDEEGYSYTYVVIVLLALVAHVVLIALATCLVKSLMARFRRARSNKRINRKVRSSSYIVVKSSNKGRHYRGPFRVDNVHDPEVESSAFRVGRDKKRLVYLGCSLRGSRQNETKIESLEELAKLPENDDASRDNKDEECAIQVKDRQPRETGGCFGRKAETLMPHKSIDKECASGDVKTIYHEAVLHGERGIGEPNIPELAGIRPENTCLLQVCQAAVDISTGPLVQLHTNPCTPEGEDAVTE